MGFLEPNFSVRGKAPRRAARGKKAPAESSESFIVEITALGIFVVCGAVSVALISDKVWKLP